MVSDEQAGRIAYPELSTPISAAHLTQRFTPTPAEITWALGQAWTSESRRGLLTLLKVFQALGRFLPPEQIPGEVIRHVGLAAGWGEHDELSYTKRTRVRHQAKVREFVQVRGWNAEARGLAERTVESLAAARARPSDLINGAIDALVRAHSELPALSTLRRIVSGIQQRVHGGLIHKIAARLNVKQADALDSMLDVPNGAQSAAFAKLCQPPGRATRANLQDLLDRLYRLESLPQTTEALDGIAPAACSNCATTGFSTRPVQTRGCQATRASHEGSLKSGYQRLNAAPSRPSTTSARTCRSRCAPVYDHLIC